MSQDSPVFSSERCIITPIPPADYSQDSAFSYREDLSMLKQ